MITAFLPKRRLSLTVAIIAACLSPAELARGDSLPADVAGRLGKRHGAFCEKRTRGLHRTDPAHLALDRQGAGDGRRR